MVRRHRRVIPYKDLINQVKQRKPQRPHIGRDWFYICTKQDGRQVLLGPYNDEREAEEIAVEKLNTDYEVVAMGTRDRAAATQQLRHKMLRGNGGNLEDSLKRMKHTI